jgi:uncharacterized repeat protein (TIGR03803 family)
VTGAPNSGLVADGAGNLYGTTGGVPPSEYGTVFRLTPPAAAGGSWSETTLFTFDGTDGTSPDSLAFDNNGNLCGTTSNGGGTGCRSYGCGTIFALTPPAQGQTAWTETMLYAFEGAADGAAPNSLLTDSNGNLFGATDYAGGKCSCGTVFELSPPAAGQTGWSLSTLVTLPPLWGLGVIGLAADGRGNLYATAHEGGPTSCFGYTCGTVFRLRKPETGTHWGFLRLFAFDGADGGFPESGVIVGPGGQLFGTTSIGGASNSGTVFVLSR